PAAMPFARTVLPAPRSPLSRTTAGPASPAAIARPRSKVSSGEEVTTSWWGADWTEAADGVALPEKEGPDGEVPVFTVRACSAFSLFLKDRAFFVGRFT